MPKEHYRFNYQSHTALNSFQRQVERNRNVNRDYYKDPHHFTLKQQQMRDRMWQRKLQNYIPGGGDKTAAIFFVTLLLMTYCIDASAASSPMGSSLKKTPTGRDKHYDAIARSCNSTTIITQNKPPGSIVDMALNEKTNRYSMTFSFPQDMPYTQQQLSLDLYYKNQQYGPNINARRNKMYSNFLAENTQLSNIFAALPISAIESTSINKTIQDNVGTYMIQKKFYLYHFMKDLYSSAERPIIGNCEETIQQACLSILPELIPDQEFFLKINCESDTPEKYGHVYGMIVTMDMLKGAALTGFSKEQFLQKFARPYFKEGRAAFITGQNGLTQQDIELFWRALGVNKKTGQTINPISEEVHLCDPYMQTGIMCNLKACAQDIKIAKTYFKTFGNIVSIEIFSWQIPKSLHSKLSQATLNLHGELNKMLLALLEQLKNVMLKMKTEL